MRLNSAMKPQRAAYNISWRAGRVIYQRSACIGCWLGFADDTPKRSCQGHTNTLLADPELQAIVAGAGVDWAGGANNCKISQ